MESFTAGDHVGIKDSVEFSHWSRRGVVVNTAEKILVRLDGSFAQIPIMPGLLVRVHENPLEDWAARAFPKDGDAPGPEMFFLSFDEVRQFVFQFQDARLDEICKIRPALSATEEQRSMLMAAGAQLL